MNRHLWLCRGSVERWIGKKILLGTENHRKANIMYQIVLNLKETIERKKCSLSYCYKTGSRN